MNEGRKVSLTLKVYAEVILPVNSDERAEEIINDMDFETCLNASNGLRICDTIVEIDDIDTEYID